MTLPQLIIESNSIGLGYYADNTGPTLYNAVGSPPFPDGFVALMLTALGGSGAYALTNNSINGGKTTDLAAADPTVGYPLLSNGAPAYVVFFFEITNDYASNGVAATCLANYQAWYAGWKAAAITAGVWGTTYIVFGTPLPRGLLPGSGGWEIARASITRSVQALGLADAIVPFGQDPVMGNVATLTNTSYYRPDYTHPLLAGHAILGPLAATGVQAAFRTTRGTPQWPIVGA